MYGHLTLLGVLIHLADAPNPRTTGRIYQRSDGMHVLHWHTADGECQDLSVRSFREAVDNGKELGLTHVFIGTTHNREDIVPIEEARLLSYLDGEATLEQVLERPSIHFHRHSKNGKVSQFPADFTPGLDNLH